MNIEVILDENYKEVSVKIFSASYSKEVEIIKEAIENLQKNPSEKIVAFKKDEINIGLNDGRLTISAKKSEETKDEKKNYIHKERKTQEMSRSMFFKDIDENGLKAKLEGGVLEITVPKKPQVQTSKKIEIE